MANNTFKEIANVLNHGEIFYIFPHIGMDGDACGSSTALCKALKSKGKTAKIIIEDSVPKNLEFLAEDWCIDIEEATEKFAGTEYISICVDCSEKSRFPKRAEFFDGGKVKICIDHHRTAEAFCDYNYIDPDAAATAELIFQLIETMGVDITESIADSIFVGITMDTGNFQYANTTKNTHEIAAKLYDVKKSFNDVSVAVYENESFEKLTLQSQILGNAQVFAGGMGVVAYVDQAMLKETGATMEDSEGCVARLRAIKGVEVAVLLKEKEDGSIKASMRAKTFADVATICQKYGGGGHTKAAGFTMEAPMNEVIELIKKEVEKSFE